jgi:hypothetical protein
MKLDEKSMWLIGIGILLAGYLALRNGIFTHGAPKWQPDGEVFGMVDYGSLANVTAAPEHNIGDVTYLPCRYPTRCGENITTLIIKGFDPLYANHPADQDWLYWPPSEVES